MNFSIKNCICIDSCNNSCIDFNAIFYRNISSSIKHFRVSFQAQIHANLVQNLIQLIALLLLVSTKNQSQIFFAIIEHVFEWKFRVYTVKILNCFILDPNESFIYAKYDVFILVDQARRSAV